VIQVQKAVIVELSVDIPDTEQGKDATVTVGTNTYKGKLTVIIVYTPPPALPAVAKVTISGPGIGTV
jgi:hypothetical protein